MLVERMRDSLQAAGGWAALQPEQGRRRPDGGSRLEGLQRPAMAGLGRGGHIRAHLCTSKRHREQCVLPQVLLMGPEMVACERRAARARPAIGERYGCRRTHTQTHTQWTQ